MKTVTIEMLKRWAFTDDLTGISNRRHMGLVEDACRDLSATAYYVAIDLNGFKVAQDQPGRGHGWGDRILRRFARFLLHGTRQVEVRSERRGSAFVKRRTLREPAQRDVVLGVGREGGDEFLVIAPSEAGAQAIARRVRGWASCGVTASAGVGPTRALADAALYVEKGARAKKAG